MSRLITFITSHIGPESCFLIAWHHVWLGHEKGWYYIISYHIQWALWIQHHSFRLGHVHVHPQLVIRAKHSLQMGPTFQLYDSLWWDPPLIKMFSFFSFFWKEVNHLFWALFGTIFGPFAFACPSLQQSEEDYFILLFDWWGWNMDPQITKVSILEREEKLFRWWRESRVEDD